MAAETTVRVTTRPDGVSVVEFNRPSKRNAFTQAMIDDFTSKLFALDQDTSVRAVVVTGSPGGPFSGRSNGPLHAKANELQREWISKNWSRFQRPRRTSGNSSGT